MADDKLHLFGGWLDNDDSDAESDANDNAGIPGSPVSAAFHLRDEDTNGATAVPNDADQLGLDSAAPAIVEPDGNSRGLGNMLAPLRQEHIGAVNPGAIMPHGAVRGGVMGLGTGYIRDDVSLAGSIPSDHGDDADDVAAQDAWGADFAPQPDAQLTQAEQAMRDAEIQAHAEAAVVAGWYAPLGAIEPRLQMVIPEGGGEAIAVHMPVTDAPHPMIGAPHAMIGAPLAMIGAPHPMIGAPLAMIGAPHPMIGAHLRVVKRNRDDDHDDVSSHTGGTTGMSPALSMLKLGDDDPAAAAQAGSDDDEYDGAEDDFEDDSEEEEDDDDDEYDGHQVRRQRHTAAIPVPAPAAIPAAGGSYCCRFADCDKTFKQPTSRNDHEAVKHLKVLRYACHHCDKAFPCKSNLNRHLKDAGKRVRLNFGQPEAAMNLRATWQQALMARPDLGTKLKAGYIIDPRTLFPVESAQHFHQVAMRGVEQEDDDDDEPDSDLD